MIKEEIRIDADSLSYTFTGLQAWTDYWLRVEAEDHQGLRSTVDLSTELKTLDETAPTLNQDLVLRSVFNTSTDILLVWNSAEDNGELAGYNLYKDNELIAELSSNELEYNVNALTPGQRL